MTTFLIATWFVSSALLGAFWALVARAVDHQPSAPRWSRHDQNPSAESPDADERAEGTRWARATARS